MKGLQAASAEGPSLLTSHRALGRKGPETPLPDSVSAPTTNLRETQLQICVRPSAGRLLLPGPEPVGSRGWSGSPQWTLNTLCRPGSEGHLIVRYRTNGLVLGVTVPSFLHRVERGQHRRGPWGPRGLPRGTAAGQAPAWPGLRPRRCSVDYLRQDGGRAGEPRRPPPRPLAVTRHGAAALSRACRSSQNKALGG